MTVNVSSGFLKVVEAVGGRGGGRGRTCHATITSHFTADLDEREGEGRRGGKKKGGFDGNCTFYHGPCPCRGLYLFLYLDHAP